MLPLLLALLLPAVYSQNSCYIYENQPYARTSVLTIKGLPTSLVINPRTKDLLFTLIDLETLQDDKVQTKMDQYILRNGVTIKIDNINGQAAAVDEKTGKIFIASDNGLHVLDETDRAKFLSFKGDDIVQLFKPNHTDDLYAVVFPDNELYVIDVQHNTKSKVKHVPCAYIFAVDYDDNIFYECESKYVKMLLKGFEEPVEFVGIPKNSGRVITTDAESRAILATNDGLYYLRSDNVIPVKLMDTDYVPSGLVFDKDDFYVSTIGVIFKYSRGECDNQIN